MLKTFTYATMGAGKTTELIKTYDQLKRRGDNVIIAKPIIDTREGDYHGWGLTGSRITKEQKSAFYFDNIQEVFDKVTFSILLLDEVQFMNPKDVDKLVRIEQEVHAYGLKTDVNAKLFPAVSEFLAKAETIKEIPMLCENKGCLNRAVAHSRYINGKLDNSGLTQVVESGNVTYKSLCMACWNKEREN